MRPVPLSNFKMGINRLRVKGLASANQLYDLVNAYITSDGSVVPREGTNLFAQLDATTKGLMAADGALNIFGNSLLGEQVWQMTAAVSGSKTGFANNATDGVFGTLTPEGASLAGALVLGMYSTASTFVIVLQGELFAPTFSLPFTDQASTAFLFGSTAGLLSSTPANTGTAIDYVGGNTVLTWDFATPPSFTSGTEYTTGLTSSAATVPSGFVYNSLVDPNSPYEPLKKIWFAKPFMGYPYVVAEFQNGDIFHYWLQNSGTWEPNTVYEDNSYILPLTTQTGLAYLANRVSAANPTWASETVVAVGTTVEPTEYTGYQYRAVAVAGSAPHTGQSEPDWPSVSGATVQEFGDFDVSSTDSGTIQPTGSTTNQLPTTITDRYGDSQTIASGGTASGTVTLPTTASTATTTWEAGTLYATGATVQPSTGQGAFTNAIPNGDFEDGNDGTWTLDSGWSFVTTGEYQGNECLQFINTSGTPAGGAFARMTNFVLVAAGTSVTLQGYLNPNNAGANAELWLDLDWYNSTDTLIGHSRSPIQEGVGYRLTTVTGVAPVGTTQVRAAIGFGSGTSHRNNAFADLLTWSLAKPAAVSNFIYEAVQPSTGVSASTEPTWPTVSGDTVDDGTVVWEAIGTSIITWEAVPIMQSGATEPSWPTFVGGAVSDPSTFTTLDSATVNTSINWVASSRQITDSKNPNTVAVALAASHVFAGDKDITDFSAAVDPTDWSTANNAGYLPTGLNSYGDNPVAVLALYRSNLMVFNAGGYQMWQVDPDPANMALLDAQPVGSIWPQACQSVANDLLFLTEVGVRNLATAGANANMAIGATGQPIDPLVKAQLNSGTYYPISLYYPGRGQYWLIFGPQAFVLTVNGSNQKTWSRYIFPASITDSALNNGDLFLRMDNNMVLELTDEALQDEVVDGVGVDFYSWMQWPYLDLGNFTGSKMMIGLDLVGDGQVGIQVAYREDDKTTFIDNPGFSSTLNVTPNYVIDVADTPPGDPVPIPVTAPSISIILNWSPNQAWSFEAANLFLADNKGAGMFAP